MPVTHKRARGQVPIGALVFFIVLFLAASGVAYVFYQQMSKRRQELQTAIEQRDSMETQVQEMEKAYLEIQKLFGWEDKNVPKRLLDQVAQQRSEMEAPLQQEAMEEMMKAIAEQMPEGAEVAPADLQEMMKALQAPMPGAPPEGTEGVAALKQLLGAEAPLSFPYQLPAPFSHGKFANLRELTYFLLDLRERYLKVWQEAKGALDKQSEARRVAETARQFEILERENQVQQVRGQLGLEIDQLKEQLAAIQSIHDGLNEKFAQEIAEKDRLAAEVSELQGTLEEKEATILDLEDKLATRAIFAKVAELEPDGKILSVDAQLGFGFINLGQRSNVQPGWRFRVVRRTTKGYEAIGEAMVRRVEEEISRVNLRVDNPRVPVVEGDFVANAAYDPKKTITLAFAGSLEAFTIEQASELVRQYGAQTADSLTPYVDYVVIGKEPGDALNDARRYGVAVMTEAQFLDYIGGSF